MQLKSLLMLLMMGSTSYISSAKRPEQISIMPKSSTSNVVRFSPIAIFYGGVGLGVSYERFIDKAERVSLYVPVYGGIRGYFIGSYANTSGNKENHSFVTMPGLRLYPRGQNKRVAYAIGSSIFASYGSENGYKQDWSNHYTEYTEGTETRLGSLITSSFTINVSNKINIGLEAAFGASLYTNIKNKTTGTNQKGLIEPMGLFSFQLGYKF